LQVNVLPEPDTTGSFPNKSLIIFPKIQNYFDFRFTFSIKSESITKNANLDLSDKKN